MFDLTQLVTLSDDELTELWVAVVKEQRDRELLRSARAQAEQIASDYAAIVAERGPKHVKNMDESAVVGPGEHVLIDGFEWVNNTQAWLSPIAAGPDKFPQGWRTAKEEDVPAADAWTIGVEYSPGDVVQFGGRAWKCLQKHTSQADWDPLKAPSLWAEA